MTLTAALCYATLLLTHSRTHPCGTRPWTTANYIARPCHGLKPRLLPSERQWSRLFLCLKGGEPLARKGDLKGRQHVNVLIDDKLREALLQSALKHERTLTQEARYGLRQYLGIEATPVEESAGASV